MTANRNPTGIRVGQTWYSRNPTGIDGDEIVVTCVIADAIFVKTKKGINLTTDPEFLRTEYSLSKQNSLFGE